MSIRNFYKVAQANDFARVFQFRLLKFGPIAFDPLTHLAYVETASLPGRAITNVTVPYMGLQFNTPGTATYPGSAGYNVTFRCDQKYNIRAALEAATFRSFDEATSSGNYGMPSDASVLELALLDKEAGEDGMAKPVRYYSLYGVWVQSLADAAYDIKDSGTVQTVQCTLAYQFWRAKQSTQVTRIDEDISPVANVSVIEPEVFTAVIRQ